MTDVDEGIEVQFQVRAENEAGVGDPSEPTDIITIEDPISMLAQFCTHNIAQIYVNKFIINRLFNGLILGPPSSPTEVKIIDASREHINITWKAPEKNGGSPITGYHVELSEADTNKWMRINSRPIKELRFKAEDGIIPEKQYVLRVRAINAVGVSDPSEISDKAFAKDPDSKHL